MSRDGDFYIDNLTFDFYLHEAGMWVLKGNIFPSGAGAGTGDVTGPASALDGTPTVFNGTTGKLIKNISYDIFKTNLALTKSDVGLANVDNTSDANKPVSTATQAEFDALTKASVGLANVDNTSDASKPVSTATQTALDLKVTGPASVTDDLPAVFDLTTGKLIKQKTYAAFKTNLALTQSDVGLANVDNTSDVNKPISTATQTALDAKVTGPASVTDDLPAVFDLTTGKLIKQKTYAAFKTNLALVKGDVGLGNVDNTSDVNKPISTATQTALDAKVTGPASVTDDLPAIFDGTTGKLVKSKTYSAFKTLLSLTKSDVGLANVDNTSDANKPISTATQTALDAKVAGPASVTDGVPALYDGTTGKLIKATTFAAFKTSLSLVKGDVGLGNVDNTSDASKPVSTATQTALDLKVTGPAGSVTDDLPAIFDGTTGELIKSKTYSAFKTLLALTKSDVGLANVDNTSDVNKPVSTATQTAINAVDIFDFALSLTATQQEQARENIYAAPFDALSYNGMQINGSHDISQERLAAGSAVNGAYIVDNWKLQFAGTMTITGLQTNSVTTFPGFSNYLRCGVSVADAAMAAGDFAAFTHSIEGTRIARLAWGTSQAQPLTIAFWTDHHRTGTYCGSVRNSALNRSYVFTYSQDVADLQQLQVITIPGDTTGTWLNTTGIGMSITFTMAAGSTFQTTAGAWGAGSFTATSAQVNAVAATTDVFRIAGLLLLPGIEAPSAARYPYIMRPSDEEILFCQRYYEKSFNQATAPAQNAGTAAAHTFGQVAAASVSQAVPPILFKVNKRAQPTMTLYNPSAASAQIRAVTGAADWTLSAVSGTGEFGCGLAGTPPAGTAAGQFSAVHWTADARL